jgi:hypothetical protein
MSNINGTVLCPYGTWSNSPFSPRRRWRPQHECLHPEASADWYVSNVSIIFDAPCLFLHHLLSASLHFVAFYAFSGTNLLTRCHSASSLFSDVFVFQKSYTGNILGIGRNRSQSSRYFTELPEPRRGDGARPEGGHTTRGGGPPLAYAGLWCEPLVHFRRRLFPYKDPPTGKT